MNCRTWAAYNMRMRSYARRNIRCCIVLAPAVAAVAAVAAVVRALPPPPVEAGTPDMTANVTLSVEVGPAAR